jgi:hypothetical protein
MTAAPGRMGRYVARHAAFAAVGVMRTARWDRGCAASLLEPISTAG